VLVRFGAVLDAVHACRRLALAPRADAVRAIGTAAARLPGHTAIRARAAAVDVALAPVLHRVGAGRRLADLREADLARAIAGPVAHLAGRASGAFAAAVL